MNTHLLLLINGWAGHYQALDNIMVFCAKDLIYVVFAVVAGAIGYSLYKRQWEQVIWFCAALVVSYCLLILASHIYVDHRPFTDHHLTLLVKHAAGKSFPSDHTTAAAAMGFALLLLSRFKMLGLAIISCSFLIGFARIFTGIHYPVDIIGGILTGFLGAAIIYAVVEIHRKGEAHV